MSFVHLLMLAALAAAQQGDGASPESGFFEGQWAFEDEACGLPTNWVMMSGGMFVSEDLTGSWEWRDEKLLLRLTDLAEDEETGEQGGKFQMEGPVELLGQDGFTFIIEPDRYEMKRCKD